MKTYNIAEIDNCNPDWNSVPVADISEYVWGSEYMPRTTAQLILCGDRFILRMVCHEASPRAVFTEYNQPVYTDSCMEFFASYDNSGRYINMEMNANGALLSCFGAGRENRTPLTQLTGGELPCVKASVSPDSWSITAEIPVLLICRVFGCEPSLFCKGYSFSGNFYKCGDDTKIPHYGMWNSVGTEKPDFHRPEYFGKLVIV